MVSRMTTVIAARTTATSAVPSARETHSMALAIDPGPAIIGMAIGKTEMSSASGVPSIEFARFSRRAVRRSNTMSSAIMNSITPPAIRKLARLMPNASSIGFPSSAKNIRIAQAIREARMAIARRCRPSVPRVRLAKMGAQPGGSMITRKVTSADPNSSIMAWARESSG